MRTHALRPIALSTALWDRSPGHPRQPRRTGPNRPSGLMLCGKTTVKPRGAVPTVGTEPRCCQRSADLNQQPSSGRIGVRYQLFGCGARSDCRPPAMWPRVEWASGGRVPCLVLRKRQPALSQAIGRGGLGGGLGQASATVGTHVIA
jgi:hypothetical protein